MGNRETGTGKEQGDRDRKRNRDGDRRTGIGACCGSSVSVVRAPNKETMKATLTQSSSKLPRFHAAK